jgi:hypothetical protein
MTITYYFIFLIGTYVNFGDLLFFNQFPTNIYLYLIFYFPSTTEQILLPVYIKSSNKTNVEENFYDSVR